MAEDFTRKPTQLVLLDRDGVVNKDSPDYIKSADEWHPIPGALEAIALMNNAGIDIALCTNQAGISRGRLSARDLASIHLRFSRELRQHNAHIALWRFCPHGPLDGCSCRKPKSAMLVDCMAELGVSPSAVAFIGDSLKDMQAALTAGCQPFLVLSGNDTGVEERARSLGVTEVAKDLAAAAQRILQINTAVLPS